MIKILIIYLLSVTGIGLSLNCIGYKIPNKIIQRDTIANSELDYGQTFTDSKQTFIIHKGEVFFRADEVGEEKRAKEVLSRLDEMLKRENERVNK